MTEQWRELKETITEMRDNDGTGSQQEVCKFLANYMETLEKQIQQLCEDTEVIKVSKGAVKARQGRFVIYDVDWLKENFYTTEEKIYGQPKQPCEDAVSRQAVINTIFYKSDNSCDVVLSTDLMDRIKQLPSVTPQQDVGKWIKVYPLGMDYEAYMCSKCKTGDWDITIGEYKFCPYCGQKKEGVEDGEDSAFD